MTGANMGSIRVFLTLVAAVSWSVGCSSSTVKHDRQVIRTIILTPSSSEMPTGWSAGEFRKVIERAAGRWSYPNVPCGVRVVVGEPRSEWLAVQDGTNLIAVRERSWCHNGRCSAATTYPLRAMAMTTTYPEGTTGRRVTEADVEINGVFFQFTDTGAQPDESARKHAVHLDSILTHEIGHVLGLADVCGDDRTQSGRPITSGCTSEDRQRVMFASGLHETPTQADVTALCALYPSAT